jgi:hypothetical protein
VRILLAIKTTLLSSERSTLPEKNEREQKFGCRRHYPNVETWQELIGLLGYPRDYFFTPNRILCRLGDSEFDDGLSWNLDLLLRLRIEADASLPFLLYELAKSGQDEFAVLFDRFVGERAEGLEEYSSGSFVGLSGSSECDLKFSLGHV